MAPKHQRAAAQGRTEGSAGALGSQSEEIKAARLLRFHTSQNGSSSNSLRAIGDEKTSARTLPRTASALTPWTYFLAVFVSRCLSMAAISNSVAPFWPAIVAVECRANRCARTGIRVI